MNQLLMKKKNNQVLSKKRKGFTLIELIIVIAIIAILAAFAIPKFGQVRENANQKADIATAKNIATLVAQGIADGSITESGDVDSTDTKVAPKLDGNIKPKAIASGGASEFHYDISSSTGNITVYYGTTVSASKQVYPTYTAS